MSHPVGRACLRRVNSGCGRAVVGLLGLSLVLAGCGTSGEKSAAEEKKAAAHTNGITVDVPDNIKLTAADSKLKFGNSATVAYAPSSERNSVVRLTVLSVQRGTISDLGAYQVDEATRKSAIYYARVKVDNVGKGDLGGALVPVGAVSPGNVLNSATRFTNDFARCPSTALPSGFGPGSSAVSCLVFLMPHFGEIRELSFRPDQRKGPITWEGPIAPRKARS